MSRHFLFIIIIIFFSSCSNKMERIINKISHKVTLIEGDTIIEFGISDKDKTLFNSHKKYYWYAGNKISNSQGGYTGKLLNGTYNLIIQNSNVLVKQGYYKNGLKHGVWKEWYESGNLKNTSCWKRGSQSGRFVDYDMNGIIIKSGTLKKGKQHKKVKEYDAAGNMEVNHYKNGELVLKEDKSKSEPEPVKDMKIIESKEKEKEEKQISKETDKTN